MLNYFNLWDLNKEKTNIVSHKNMKYNYNPMKIQRYLCYEKSVGCR